MDTRTSPARLRINQVREAMQRHAIDAILVPSSDPHLSEYLPAHWQSREWLSGFTGSMGTLVVSHTKAALFADSRYWTQAEAELAGSGIVLERIMSAASPAHVEWLARETSAGQTVAVDAKVIGLASAQKLRAALDAKGVSLRTDIDLFAEVWADRPTLPAAPVYEHEAPYATQTRADKLAQLRAAMQAQGATHHLVSTLDDIAWLFNLRGSDVVYNPVFLAHALIDARQALLFVAEGKADAALRARLAADGVHIAPYPQAAAAVAALPVDAVLLLDPRRVTLALREQVPGGVRVVEAI
ncbi:MAG TPA: aminopeptidase P family N-terminal domain-containing protein, partial [Burkholderiaceae bacterium]|nr:aminopeptidase P family N-terminal domain-containing protein [Burkholderiaceae bacterium]